MDGGFINNVPEGILSREGADLVIASNVVHPPALAPEGSGGFFYEFNPWQRGLDMVRSFSVLIRIADERDKDRGQATFRPPRASVPFWTLKNGDSLRQMSQPRAREFARRIRVGWEQDDLEAIAAASIEDDS